MKNIAFLQENFESIEDVADKITDLTTYRKEFLIHLYFSIEMMIDSQENQCFDIIVVVDKYRDIQDEKQTMKKMLSLTQKSKVWLFSSWNVETFMAYYGLQVHPFEKIFIEPERLVEELEKMIHVEK
ncbi:MAG TPA: hypothetical protein PKD96_00475 [Candidatus Absconditabacterales bacterium]|nr:hypothetical protein [Candidatus Absconditabacterales bacterium]HMT26755.1 hypothetical protein [Candidatus Absconditabacterales bacterium]